MLRFFIHSGESDLRIDSFSNLGAKSERIFIERAKTNGKFLCRKLFRFRWVHESKIGLAQNFFNFFDSALNTAWRRDSSGEPIISHNSVEEPSFRVKTLVGMQTCFPTVSSCFPDAEQWKAKVLRQPQHTSGPRDCTGIAQHLIELQTKKQGSSRKTQTWPHVCQNTYLNNIDITSHQSTVTQTNTLLCTEPQQPLYYKGQKAYS